MKRRIKDILKIFVALGFRIRRAMRPSFQTGQLRPPQRILLVNSSHIGDVVISTSVLPILRAAWPSAEFGFLTGPWAQMIVSDHPEIRYHHVIVPRKHNRDTTGTIRKWRQYLRSRAAALLEVRNVSYDVAICLHSHAPDLLEFAWTAGIPQRIGFCSSLHAAYATQLMEVPRGPNYYEGARQAELLRALPIPPECFSLRRSTLPPSDAAALEEVQKLLGRGKDLNGYRIIHMGAGLRCNEMPLEFWHEVAKKLSNEHLLLFTGHGSRESSNVERVIADLPNCVNACGQLSWKGFVAAVRHAVVLYGVDSAAGHVAAAVGTRSVTLMSGKDDLGRWRPDGPMSAVLTKSVPCSPCYRESGCDAMTCLRTIDPSELVSLG